MNKNIPQISYDKESKVLSVEIRRARSVDSDIQGNAVLDYDKKGNIVRINLYNFNFDVFRGSVKSLRDFARVLKVPIKNR